MLHEIENTGLHIAKLTGAVYAINLAPDVFQVAQDNNPITRGLKKGFLYYVANEAVESATLGNSNFNKMGTLEGWKNLIDDTVLYGAATVVDEQIGISQRLVSMIPADAPLPANLADSFVNAVILYGTKVLGTKVENQMIKHVSDLFM